MARTVKPEYFRDSRLADLERDTGHPIRLALIGVQTCCDRDGRFVWDTKSLKLDIFPYDDDADMESIMQILHEADVVKRYRVGQHHFGIVTEFFDMQHINPRERASAIPGPDDSRATFIKPNGNAVAKRGRPPVVIPPAPDASELPVVAGSNKMFTKIGGHPYRTEPNGSQTLVASTEDESDVFAKIMLVGDLEIGISVGKVQEWQEAFPHLDVQASVRSAIQWSKDNPAKRKTLTGVSKYIGGWIERDQNSGRGGSTQPGSTVGRFQRRNTGTERVNEVLDDVLGSGGLFGNLTAANSRAKAEYEVGAEEAR